MSFADLMTSLLSGMIGASMMVVVLMVMRPTKAKEPAAAANHEPAVVGEATVVGAVEARLLGKAPPRAPSTGQLLHLTDKANGTGYGQRERPPLPPRSPSPQVRRPKQPTLEVLEKHTLREASHKSVALVVVDCQPAYWDANPGLRQTFPNLPRNVEKLLAQARHDLAPPQIIHVRANYTYRFAENFARLNPDKTLPHDVAACEWASSLTGERIVVKSSFDSFHATHLEEHLAAMGVTDVVFCGLLTSVCVLFTMQSAFARGFRVRLFTEGCADRSRERHDMAISLYRDYCFEVYDDINTIFEEYVQPDSPPAS